MANGYTFSAGPWIIESWDKGVSVTLVPNEEYAGTKPSLDKVVFKFLTDTAAGFQAIQNNEVSVLYPSPSSTRWSRSRPARSPTSTPR